MIKDENYITIQGWMRTKLGLKGNDLLVYAVIYSFSQTENQRFTGSLQYIADWCGATKQGILKNIKNLIDKGLICKEELGVNSVAYYSTQFNTPLNSVYPPIKLSLINNIDNTKKENKTISKDIVEEKPKKKNLYGKCVDAIDNFTESEEVRELLRTYLRYRLEIKDKPIYVNQWIGMLNKLRDLTESKTECIGIIQQSIDRGYLSFFPLSKSKQSRSTACETNVSCATMTDEEIEKQNEFVEELKSRGKQVEF